MKQRILIFLIITATLGTSAFQYVYQKVSMEMLTRSTKKGRISTLKAKIFYTSEGKMVSYYHEPLEMLVTNNKKGDISIFNFKENSITQKQNFLFGTEQNQMFFFLENNKSDLGLAKMGFVLNETKFEDGLKITVWIPPFALARQISRVELVHEKGNPIFLGYFDQKGKAVKKSFFYNYTQVASVNFPASVTQVTYENANDSTISKVSYSNFKLDNDVSDEYLNFKIPDDAKTILN